MSTIDLKALPNVRHPFTDYSLADAVQLARGHRSLCLQPEPATLEEVREVIREMSRRADFLWMTGMAALDVLDAIIDGRDLRADCRFL